MTPAWPYLYRPVSELKADIDPRFADQTVKMLVDHYAQQIERLCEPPILIGHSFGGLIVQLLLDRGLGCMGVALEARPPRGVLPSLPAIRSALPVLLSWNGWNKLQTMSFAGSSKSFANSLPKAE